MRSFYLTLLLCVWLAVQLFAQEPPHVQTRLGVVNAPSTANVMFQRLSDAAETYHDRAPIPRVAFIDIALPADPLEFQTLAGHAIVLVTALAQDSVELPLKRALVAHASGTQELRLLFSFQSTVPVECETIRATLGSHRSDSFFLLPLELKREGNEILVDFAAHRKGFRLYALDDTLPEQLVGLSVKVRRPDDPQTDDVLKFILREFPGILWMDAE